MEFPKVQPLVPLNRIVQPKHNYFGIIDGDKKVFTQRVIQNGFVAAYNTLSGVPKIKYNIPCGICINLVSHTADISRYVDQDTPQIIKTYKIFMLPGYYNTCTMYQYGINCFPDDKFISTENVNIDWGLNYDKVDYEYNIKINNELTNELVDRSSMLLNGRCDIKPITYDSQKWFLSGPFNKKLDNISYMRYVIYNDDNTEDVSFILYKWYYYNDDDTIIQFNIATARQLETTFRQCSIYDSMKSESTIIINPLIIDGVQKGHTIEFEGFIGTPYNKLQRIGTTITQKYIGSVIQCICIINNITLINNTLSKEN